MEINYSLIENMAFSCILPILRGCKDYPSKRCEDNSGFEIKLRILSWPI
jgi:hypothetical protein